MFKRIRMFFGWTEPVIPVVEPEILYCEDDGEKLIVTETVLKYSPYTGQPSKKSTMKNCPKCGRLVEGKTV